MVFYYLPFVQQPPSPRAFYKQNMTGITFSVIVIHKLWAAASLKADISFSPCPPPSQTEWHFLGTKLPNEENHFKKPQTSMVPIDTDQCSPFAYCPQAKNNSEDFMDHMETSTETDLAEKPTVGTH